MGQMPVLPRPLRDVLGARAKRFDTILQQLLADIPQAHHIPLEFDLDPSVAAASDGFHPGPEIYRLWAEKISTRIKAHFTAC